MSRLVDADELKLELKWLEIDKPVYHDVMSTIDEIATVDTEPVKHGHWRTVTLPSYMFEGYRCSQCAELVYGRTKYCPQCGAKMDEVADDES